MMTKLVTVVCRVDDAIVWRSFRSATEALVAYEAIRSKLYAHWVVVRDRRTGGSLSWRAQA